MQMCMGHSVTNVVPLPPPHIFVFGTLVTSMNTTRWASRVRVVEKWRKSRGVSVGGRGGFASPPPRAVSRRCHDRSSGNFHGKLNDQLRGVTAACLLEGCAANEQKKNPLPRSPPLRRDGWALPPLLSSHRLIESMKSSDYP